LACATKIRIDKKPLVASFSGQSAYLFLNGDEDAPVVHYQAHRYFASHLATAGDLLLSFITLPIFAIVLG
jgi:hypothetical protein